MEENDIVFTVIVWPKRKNRKPGESGEDNSRAVEVKVNADDILEAAKRKSGFKESELAHWEMRGIHIETS